MEPNNRVKASFPPQYFAVQAVGAAALALGLISLFSSLRPMIIGMAPWLGIAWIAWTVAGFGIFLLVANGMRWVAHARGTKHSA
ncbi:MAG TPA: hypothetical protein VME63_06470 [Dyella sp.]|uniref:hypothetical protein n=1 Tax=Dyella sp. TaxID=1869338 RepID=UPI002C86B2C8|nr:hypothetical protein [Dyella sp.]HTV85028.1 hypothetical protein [Dyella sp.]